MKIVDNVTSWDNSLKVGDVIFTTNSTSNYYMVICVKQNEKLKLATLDLEKLTVSKLYDSKEEILETIRKANENSSAPCEIISNEKVTIMFE
ncbi:hypothetical protein V1503_24875 [Bacillus sp. SCS-151]|uniref:hypothetical protein n=1 Tax=Nanhaiella sioensis TaxID=3115293 RepID=UPI00397CDF7C